MAQDALFEATEVGPPTWTVAELAAHITRITAGAFPTDLWIEGQIRNLSRSANGHAYFDLAEPTASGQSPRAQITVILRAPERRSVNQRLIRAGGAVKMEDGIEVRIQGRLRWYSPRGVLQVQMSDIDPAFTLGRLQADRDRILAALARDGLLDANSRHRMALVPLRIGLVTSKGTAAYADAMSELEASGIGFEVHVADARTQGLDCGPSVARALHLLGQGISSGRRPLDVILVIRGGGARTDLAGFDTDIIARAIAAMPVPVLTGIGHEVDRSIADEVAHTPHKTPTAAAAAVVNQVRSFALQVDQTWLRLRRAAASTAGVAESRLARRSDRLARAAGRTLDRHSSGLATTGRRIHDGAGRSLHRSVDRLAGVELALAGRSRRQLQMAEQMVATLAAGTRSHDPELALARGWTITTSADGQPIRSATDLAVGNEIVTRFAVGTVRSTVTEELNMPAEVPGDPRQVNQSSAPPEETTR